MLGLGLNLTSIGNSLLNVVRSGLQLWYKADETQAPLGEEEIIDGDFSPTSPNAPNFNKWTKGPNWTISGGYVTSDGSAAGNLDQTALTDNRRYKVTLDVSNMTTSTLSVRLGGTNEIANINANGTYTFYGTSNATVFRLRSAAGFDGSVTNISVKEVVNSVKDFSPNNNNGVLYSGKCLFFDQANTYIDIDYWKSKTIDANTKATFATWFNCHDIASESPNLGDGRDIIFANRFLTDNNFFLGIINRKLELGWGGSSWQSDSNAISVDNRTWYRVVVVVDGLTCKVYLNGEFAFSKSNGTTSFTLHNDGISIGAQGDAVGDHFYGELADFQIYDKAWTTSDVTYDYNNPDRDVFDNSNSSITTTDCQALYRLNEGAGNRVYNAAPVLKEDIHSGYDLDDWSALSNATINSPTTFSTSSASTGIYKIHITSGSNYKLTIAGTTESNGLQFANPSTGSEVYWDSGSSAGAFSDTVIFNAKSNQIYLKNKTAGETTITTLKLQEISLSDSYVQASWASSNWITAQPYIPQYAMSSYSKKAIFGGANSGDYVDLGSQVTVAADKAASISFWFTYGTTDTSTDKYILGKVSSATDYLIINPQSSGVDKIQIQMNNQTALAFNIETDLTLGKMYHCVVTIPAYSSGSEAVKCYINGVQQSDTENRTNDPWDFQRIGGSTGTVNNFDGILDEIAYFSKELSQAEVQEIFNAGMALDCRDHSAYLGSEIVTDGGFDDPTEWNANTGWTVSGGKASVDSSGTTDIRQTLSVTQGKIYDLTFEISDYTEGTFQFGFNQFNIAGTSSNLPNFDEDGIYNYRVVALSDDINVYMYGVNASEFSIDNLSLREVQLNGYWRNNGTDTWTDLSPYGNNGTVSGSPTTIQLQEVPYFKKDTFGLPMNKVRQKGLNLDGNSYIKVDDHNDFNMSSGFSTSFWVNCRDINTRQWLVTKGTAVNTYASNLGFGTAIFKPDGLYTRIYASINTDVNKYQVHTTEAIVENDWLYVTITYTPNTTDGFKLYIDESEIDTKTPNTNATVDETHDLYIGENYELNTGYRCYSIVDEVKWYNRPLSLSEIKKNYKATKSQHKNNTVSNWSDDFDDGFI